MKALLVSLGCGALFGVGLVVSGMNDPSNIISFLNVSGHWNASLAAVMVGAIGVHAAALRIFSSRSARPSAEPRSSAGRIDRSLVVGAAVFGVGWGLTGYCPGPAVASLATGSWGSVVFVVAMLAGVVLADTWSSRRTSLDAGSVEPLSENAPGRLPEG
jgi:uncharacterized membrane protein YedE/YeeE